MQCMYSKQYNVFFYKFKDGSCTETFQLSVCVYVLPDFPLLKCDKFKKINCDLIYCHIATFL